MIRNFFYMVFFIIVINVLSCNSNIKNEMIRDEEICAVNSQFYINALNNKNILYNAVYNSKDFSQRLREILEDDYGVYVFFGTDIVNCNDLNELLLTDFYSKVNYSLVNEIKESISKLGIKSDSLFYSKDGIPIIYDINPKFNGQLAKFDSIIDLRNIKVPSVYSNDTLLLSYKLWIDTNGGISKKNQLLKSNIFWNTIGDSLINKISFVPARKKNGQGILEKVPSIYYINFSRNKYKTIVRDNTIF